MIPLICSQNVDGASPDAVALTSSNLHRKPPIRFPSTLFRSDLPPSDYKKMDEELVGEFLWRDVRCCIGIKDSLCKQARFCEYT